MPFGKKKKLSPEEFKLLQAKLAREYVPWISSFREKIANKEHASNEQIVDDYRKLEKSLRASMNKLGQASPAIGVMYQLALQEAQTNLKNKKLVRAFVTSGNMEMLKRMYVNLLRILFETARGL